jgi:drug/metabolite transporter (DMT)-like permease
MSQRSIGVLQIVLSGACFGLLGYFGKSAYQAGITPAEFLALRFLVAAAMMAAFLLITRQKFWTLSPRTVGTSLLLGAVGYAVFASCFFYALKGLSASLTVLLLYLYPTMVSVCGHFFLNEKLGKKGLFALLLSTIGMVGLVWGDMQVNEPIYLILAFSSAVFYSIYIIVSRKVLKGVPPLHSTFFILVGASIPLFLISFSDVNRPLEIIENNALVIFGIAFVCSLLAMTLFQAGLQKVKSSEASILSTTEPLFGVLFAIILLHEPLSAMQLLGAVMVLTATVILARK